MSFTPNSKEAGLRIVDLITTNEDRKFAPIAQMADTIMSIIALKGECSREDLKTHGFLREQIESDWHIAQSLAKIEAILRNGI